ncbi:Anaerobic sulfite reductase subunit A [Neomoorella glycerini]|uniref:Anaerobic sulfite reductase subunit A n=1 Tax=Neomoorella glycerini TaxID=55779 RepID=A0A6I5ZN90_9FIRM|nr:4Fe-4S dicluster domain-containing protein [Moorella glycerini]QGP91075.1 Anaerobic sulfite reductase subunit A [Moorella glycerini]
MSVAYARQAEWGIPQLYLLPAAKLNPFLEELKEYYTVIGPVARGKEFVFAPVAKPEELALSYQTTLLPPKKVLHLPFEVLFSFHEDQQIVETAPEQRPQVIFGIHPCDVRAILILDKAYTAEYPDPYYIAKRRHTLLVALNCAEPGENCFCQSLGTGPDLKEGYDLLLTDLGHGYLIEVGSPWGRELVQTMDLAPAPRVAMVEKQKVLENARRKFHKKLNTQGLPELLEENFRHPIWEELMHDCLACGSCTMVCPTCFCYNVVDKIDLNLKSGKRQREWDSCMLLEYAQVALGHNFRKDRDARVKQRIYHKLVYYEPQFSTLGCVGCGRCIKTCVKKIDITDVISRLRGE